MRAHGRRGVTPRKKVRTTIADPAATRATDLVKRQVRVPAPNVLLVADFTYVRLANGAFVYTAFAIDAYAGRIVGWTCSVSQEERFVRHAIRHAAQLRRNEGNPLLDRPIHHGDAGSRGGFNWSSQHHVVSLSVVGWQRLPWVFSTRAFCGAGC
jgi:transposase InsO family protein